MGLRGVSKCTVSYNHASFSEKNCELDHAGKKIYKSKEAKKINPFVRRGRNERVRVNKQIETTKQGRSASKCKNKSYRFINPL